MLGCVSEGDMVRVAEQEELLYKLNEKAKSSTEHLQEKKATCPQSEDKSKGCSAEAPDCSISPGQQCTAGLQSMPILFVILAVFVAIYIYRSEQFSAHLG